jgi:hypothetical protein
LKFKILILPLVLCVASCQQYDFVEDSGATLMFSRDTLDCDTVFAPFGSTTFSCKVFNPSNKNLRFDEVRLQQGATSPFRINVDGQAGHSVRNVKLAQKDSLFIFVEVKKNEALQLTVLLTDAVVFVANGVELRSRLELVAYGQEVWLLDRDTTLPNGYIFTADKPYVITCQLEVDTGFVANIEAGAKLYFGNSSGLTVHGKLNVNGTQTQPCTLSFVRHYDLWYATAVGQWSGITISASGSANVSNTWIRGADAAFNLVDTLGEASHTQLVLSQTLVDYANIGIHSRGGKLLADNCLVADCRNNAVLAEGGSCELYHCTFAAQYRQGQNDYHGTMLVLQNFCLREKTKLSFDTLHIPLTAYVGNCIAYGNNHNELSLHELKQHSATPMNITFESCILKLDNSYDVSNGERYISVSKKDPLLKNVAKRDFYLSEKSPAINAGANAITLMHPLDLDGNDRTALHDTSLGCYAYQPQQ